MRPPLGASIRDGSYEQLLSLKRKFEVLKASKGEQEQLKFLGVSQGREVTLVPSCVVLVDLGSIGGGRGG
jgi:hypothetical protein